MCCSFVFALNDLRRIPSSKRSLHPRRTPRRPHIRRQGLAGDPYTTLQISLSRRSRWLPKQYSALKQLNSRSVGSDWPLLEECLRASLRERALSRIRTNTYGKTLPRIRVFRSGPADQPASCGAGGFGDGDVETASETESKIRFGHFAVSRAVRITRGSSRQFACRPMSMRSATCRKAVTKSSVSSPEEPGRAQHPPDGLSKAPESRDDQRVRPHLRGFRRLRLRAASPGTEHAVTVHERDRCHQHRQPDYDDQRIGNPAVQDCVRGGQRKRYERPITALRRDHAQVLRSLGGRSPCPPRGSRAPRRAAAGGTAVRRSPPRRGRSRLRRAVLFSRRRGSGYFAATTRISTLNSGRARRDSTQARAGACPFGTHMSHTAFIGS